MYGSGMYPGGAVPGAYAYSPTPGQQSQASSSRQAREGPQQSTYTEGKVFIGGIHPKISTEDIMEHCSAWGEVVDAVAIKDRGYGFATFAEPAAAQRFLEAREHVVKGVRLDVKAAMPKVMGGAARRTRKMFVGGTGELTDEDLREHFSQYGVIEDAAVIRRDNKSRGFGFITFSDETSVEKCLVQHHIIKNRKVELKRAVPKEEFGGPMGAMGGPMGGMGAMGPAMYGAYPQQGAAGGYGAGYPMGMRPAGVMDPYMMMQMGYPAMWGYPAYQYPGMQMAPMSWGEAAAGAAGGMGSGSFGRGAVAGGGGMRPRGGAGGEVNPSGAASGGQRGQMGPRGITPRVPSGDGPAAAAAGSGAGGSSSSSLPASLGTEAEVAAAASQLAATGLTTPTSSSQQRPAPAVAAGLANPGMVPAAAAGSSGPPGVSALQSKAGMAAPAAAPAAPAGVTGVTHGDVIDSDVRPPGGSDQQR